MNYRTQEHINSEQRRLKFKLHIHEFINKSDELTMTEAIEVLSGLINTGMHNMLYAPGRDEAAKDVLP